MDVVVARLQRAEIPAVREILDACGLEVDLERELERSFALPWVARVPDAAVPVGFLLAWHAADELHLTDLGTRPGFRRRGVGRALVEALVAHGRTHGASVVLLELRRGNDAARRLYASLGFEVSGERKGYYSSDGEDAVEMRLVLR